jgi:hypothetical protein
MYDVNPQGPLMHLKELERRAIALRASGERHSHLKALGVWLTIALRRIFSHRSDTRTSKPLFR